MTGEGIWEGLTSMIEIFDRTDPAKTGRSNPSTAADSTVNKDATDNNAVEPPQTETKKSSSAATDQAKTGKGE